MSLDLPASLVEHQEVLQDDAIADAQLVTRMRQALIWIGILVFGLGLAAAFVPIGGAIIGSGQLGAETRIKRIAHPTGGVVKTVLVDNGRHVRAGDVLIRLDPTISTADAAFTGRSVSQLLAQRARLEGERIGATEIRWPPTLAGDSSEGARRALADEDRLFTLRRSENASMRAQVESRIAQFNQEINGYRAQIAALRRQQALIEPERRGVRELWEKDLVTINRLNQLERTQSEMEGSVGALQASIAQAQGRIAEARQQIIQIGESRRSEAGTQLAQVNTMLNEQQLRSVSATDQLSRTEIRAPYDGIVDKLRFTAAGDVIQPAETIMEIVPDRDQLIVEAAIGPTDIEQVRTGQPARIRFTSFDATSTPEVVGKVIFVAAERTTDPKSGAGYFLVRVQIDKTDLSRKGNLPLRAGMPAELFIETGSRSMLSYLTRPLIDQMARAFKDN
ncbi:MAG: HlyD family type I secretion periplasmic adaptor subunit [Novosphingobium sp.]